jgi:hypothetical protein
MSTRLESDPTAMMTCLAESSCFFASWLTVTVPRPVIRPSPRYTVAPAFSSDLTWLVSSGSSASAGRLIMKSR